MILQSLCHHLQTQLTEYYRLIAVLESQMSTQLLTNHSEDGQDNTADQDTGLTLRRLDVWINDWRLRMRMMSVCVEGARSIIHVIYFSDNRYSRSSIDAHGGALVNLIHGYTDNGDPFIRKFTDELLEEVHFHIPAMAESSLQFLPGIKAILRHIAQMAVLWRTL
jgi:gamma-tubulin complex component 3